MFIQKTEDMNNSAFPFLGVKIDFRLPVVRIRRLDYKKDDPKTRKEKDILHGLYRSGFV